MFYFGIGRSSAVRARKCKADLVNGSYSFFSFQCSPVFISSQCCVIPVWLKHSFWSDHLYENMAHRVCFCTLFPSARDADEREKWIHALEGTILRHTLQLRVCSKPPCLYAYGCVLTSKINTGVGILDVHLPVSTSVCSLKEMKLEDERKCEF